MATDFAIPEGYVQDFITGEPLKDTPKEYVRQDLARALFHEYGFRVEDMERDYWIAVEGDAGQAQRHRADIVIFPSGQADHSGQADGVVACRAAGAAQHAGQALGRS